MPRPRRDGTAAREEMKCKFTELCIRRLARVRMPNGAVLKLEVQAQSAANARAMMEAQYGKANVIYVGR